VKASLTAIVIVKPAGGLRGQKRDTTSAIKRPHFGGRANRGRLIRFYRRPQWFEVFKTRTANYSDSILSRITSCARHRRIMPNAPMWVGALDQFPAARAARPCKHAPNPATAKGSEPAIAKFWRGLLESFHVELESGTATSGPAARRVRRQKRRKAL